jgi:K+-transporting ATPase KdpF subunit
MKAAGRDACATEETMETILAAIVALALAAYLLYALLRPERF